MKQQHKILYVITKSEPWGGAQRYVYDLATNLPRSQYDVAVALGVDESNGSCTPVRSEASKQPLSSKARQVVDGNKGLLKTKLEEDGVKTLELSSAQRDVNFLKEVKLFFELYKLFKDEQPDTIHLNSSKVGGLGAFVGRVCGVKNIIFTSHGLVFEENRNSVIRLLFRFLTWLTFLLSSKIILISKANKERVDCMPFIKSKTVHIYNAVTSLTLLPKRKARAIILNKVSIRTSEKNEIWIGTISELTKNKGLDTIIRAYAHIVKSNPYTRFFIIGDGTERGVLETLVLQLNLSRHVFLLGYIENASTFLSAFDIFTLTSTKEGHPYALLEAAEASLPVIGSKISGITDVIEHGKNGLLIDPNDHMTIADALLKLRDDPKLRNMFGQRLKEKVGSKFSLESMLEKTYALY